MPEELDKLLARPEFPLANQYDAGWVIENQMGLYATGRSASRACPFPG
jgi:hypothetical protein